jgi:Zn-finger domain associated with topoisomerase type I
MTTLIFNLPGIILFWLLLVGTPLSLWIWYQCTKGVAKAIYKEIKQDNPDVIIYPDVICPICGATMRKRKHTVSGKFFWVCGMYPNCTGNCSIE